MQRAALSVSPGSAGLSEGRGFVDRMLAAAGFDLAARYQIAVATNEAVSNAMEHGEPCDDGLIHLAAGVEDGSFVFSVRDGGKFEDSPSPPPDPVAERGRGFAFMNLLMDEVRLDARAGETTLRLTKRLPGAPDPAGDTLPASSERNLEVVRELFRAFAERDVERTLRVVDRGVMIEPLSTPVERRTPYLGTSGVRRYMRDLGETWERFEISIDELRAEADYVVASGRIYAQHPNLVADDPAGFVFRLRHARVVWAKVYRSSDEALAAAGIS